MNLRSMFRCVLSTAGEWGGEEVLQAMWPRPTRPLLTSSELESHVSLSLRGGSCHCASNRPMISFSLPLSLCRSLTQSPLRLLARPPKVSRLPLRCHILTVFVSLTHFFLSFLQNRVITSSSPTPAGDSPRRPDQEP